MRSGQDVIQSYAVDNNAQDFANGAFVTDAQDIAPDALSAPRASQAQVLDDLSSSASDDGHAMMQIVHDVALDASLASLIADNSEQGFSEQDFANSTLTTDAQDIAFGALNAPQVSTWQSSMTLSGNPGGASTDICTGGEGIVSYHPAGNLQVDAPTVSADVAAMPAAAAFTAAPADFAILGNPVEGPIEGPVTNTTIGPNGATPAQVQQALDESGLSVNGTGITVGVLSDSFNNLGGAAADEADGALPSASQVHILSDLSSGGSDEGRAMMQIVHDVAPGATLDFYSAEGSQQTFANGILALAAAGCKVICDDITYFAEPFFQTGVIANAIQTVEQEGVTFLTCAGNQANVACQTAWTSIASTSYDGTTLTNTENFGSNNSPSPVQTISTGGTAYNASDPLILQWNQPYGATTANLEVLVFYNGSLYETATNTSSGEANNPDIQLNLPLGYTFQVAVENLNSSSTNPTLIKDEVYNDYSNVTVSISGENAGTVYGHHMSPYAITVGAASTADTPAFGVNPAVSENFSSSGLNTQLWFNYDGTPVTGGPLDLSPVAVTGVDDINTTVAGGLTDFYGTSAATPSVAGVVALMLQANPNLTPTQIDEILQASTTSMANPAVSGAGLVQANVAVAAALAAENGPSVTEELVSDTGSSSSDNITSKDALTGSGDPNAVVHFTVDGNSISSTATANSSGTWTFSPSGLADGVHTIVASETNASGNTGTASLTFTLDTTKPAVTESLFSDTGSSSTDKLTSDDELTGYGDPNATVTFKQGTTTLGTTSADGTGNWTFTPSGLTDGAHTIVASETDVAGNLGSASLTFTLDTTAPKVTESLKTDTGSSTSDKITSNDALTGTSDAKAVIHFTVDGNPIATTVTAGRTGAWSFTPTGLSDGTHTIVASETDAAGNTGTASLTFTFDKTAPVPTITSEVLNLGNTVTLTGSTAEANDKISVYDGKTVLGTTTTANDGTWSFTTATESTSKAHTYTATATDLAGNIGHSSNEAILGSTKADTISGTSGNDFIIGNLGADKITGGAGADTFIYNAAADSTPASHDTIIGFTHGADIIDLTNIPGITASGGVPTFQGQLSGAGNLILNANSVAYIEVGSNTEVLINTTNSAETVTTSSVTAANMEIVLAGIHLGLTSADFYHA